MAEYPELIDIGIMEKCICSSKCKVDCYQKACDRTGSNMSFDNYKKIIDESKGKVFQVALGGAGDPDTHENFADILKYTAESNIVPNFTTSGIALTKEKAELCYRYCGAVAVSEHFEDYTDKAVELLIQSKVKTNIHFVLNTETIDKAIEILGTNKYRKGINAIIFLLYKPVGLGKQEKILKYSNPKVREFFELVNKHEYDFKIGFDSCSCTALLNFSNNIDFEMIDYCEGGRYSMYISADMKAYPCSFANQHTELGFDISNNTIQNAWSSFNYFRNKLTQRCLACNDRCFCGGGCPLLSSIILCNRKERSAERGIIE
jgi:radical SAM protein with 4Fe4S-binding SPASM domain